MAVRTRFFIISDTHGHDDVVAEKSLAQQTDVVIHCGDLTEESKIGEFHKTLQLLRRLRAPLKLVIAGNHDLTLDEPTFQQRVAESPDLLEPELVQKTFGPPGAPRRLLEQARDEGIHFLDEGTHEFDLRSGARLRVYASPFTPATPSTGGWAYQYTAGPQRHFDVPEDVHVAITTHGPPLGMLDRAADGKRIGCTWLFAAIATARPLMHCFGHVHGNWGAQLATWRGGCGESPSHFTAFDHERSAVVEKLANLVPGKFDDTATAKTKTDRAEAYAAQGFCSATGPALPGSQTLFVNAAIEGNGDLPSHPPWITEINLPRAK